MIYISNPIHAHYHWYICQISLCYTQGGVQYEDENDRPFYDSEDGANSENSDETNEDKTKKTSVKKKSQINSNALDSDHRLLLRSANPLLQSRNAGVVMAVAQLYYHAGPGNIFIIFF